MRRGTDRRLTAVAALIFLFVSGGSLSAASGPHAASGRVIDSLYGYADSPVSVTVVPLAQPTGAPAATGGIVALKPDNFNTSAFIDSLFDGDVRNFDHYRGIVFSEGRDRFSFSPANESRILESFTNYWTGGPDTGLNRTDKLLLDFIHGYAAENGLVMYKPVIRFSGVSAAGLPVYAISGYKIYDILNSRQAAREFLELMLLGAHYVVVDGKQDNPGTNSFIRSFRNNAEIGKLTAGNLGNSHYTGLVRLGSYNYLKIREDKAPASSPFICSFIAGRTAQHDPDTFFQLEGWPSGLHLLKEEDPAVDDDEEEAPPDTATNKSLFSNPFGVRHVRDFKTHKATVWNISTYGASAYSEKRGTAIFLARPDWNPQLRSDTIMPHYRGADTPQKWLKKDLAVIAAPETGEISPVR